MPNVELTCFLLENDAGHTEIDCPGLMAQHYALRLGAASHQRHRETMFAAGLPVLRDRADSPPLTRLKFKGETTSTGWSPPLPKSDVLLFFRKIRTRRGIVQDGALSKGTEHS